MLLPKLRHNQKEVPLEFFFLRAFSNIQALIGVDLNTDFFEESTIVDWSFIDQFVSNLAYEEALIAYQNQFYS